MKKNLLGLLAIVCAVGFVAFTTPKEDRFASKFFEFTGTLTSEAQVEDVDGNWVEVTSIGNPTPCNNTDRKACRVEVDEANTLLVGGVRKMDPAKVAIIANLYAAGGTYYVAPSGHTAIIAKRNKL